MEVINALGRRKSAVARVYVSEGSGKITINKRDLTEYFPNPILQFVVKQPLALLDAVEKYYKPAAFHACREADFKLAVLGNDAGMYGAVRMILAK